MTFLHIPQEQAPNGEEFSSYSQYSNIVIENVLPFVSVTLIVALSRLKEAMESCDVILLSSYPLQNEYSTILHSQNFSQLWNHQVANFRD